MLEKLLGGDRTGPPRHGNVSRLWSLTHQTYFGLAMKWRTGVSQ